MRHLTVAIVLAVASPTLAWGSDGHRIAGEIAFQEFEPAARAEVIRLTSLDPRYGRFNESCNWVDHIKSDATWNCAKPLHYTNIAGTIGESDAQVRKYDADRDCTRDTDCLDGIPCPCNACVVAAITYYAIVLGDTHASDDEKLMAFKFLGHCVGDLHEPLHAGFKHDKGGNDKRVSFFNQKSNLHKVWDSAMLTRDVIDWFQFATDLHDCVSPDRRSSSSAELDPANWASESHALCPMIYRAVPSSGEIGEHFQSVMMPEAKLRLQAAGIRLGALLNDILDGR